MFFILHSCLLFIVCHIYIIHTVKYEAAFGIFTVCRVQLKMANFYSLASEQINEQADMCSSKVHANV